MTKFDIERKGNLIIYKVKERTNVYILDDNDGTDDGERRPCYFIEC